MYIILSLYLIALTGTLNRATYGFQSPEGDNEVKMHETASLLPSSPQGPPNSKATLSGQYRYLVDSITK